MARYVVAVSGGVDSVVMLDLVARARGHELIVAHFDHGIRPDSAEDELFVRELAARYNLPYESRREELGKSASEALARERRYAFLRELADKYDAQIMTAHHSDDVLETIAINVHRGTGWRGLAAMDSEIARPLIRHSKGHLLAYAKARGLEWREDSTNQTDAYLRNRLRRTMSALTKDQRQQLLALRRHQLVAKKRIDREVERLIGPGPTYSRYFFTHIPSAVAVECLRALTKARLTRPQLERALLAIKTAGPGARYHAGSGITLCFTTRNFFL